MNAHVDVRDKLKPYRYFSVPLYKSVAQLNSTLGKQGHHDLYAWLLNSLNNALRLEMYLTAEGMIRYLEQHFSRFSTEQKKFFLRCYTSYALMDGNLDRARQYLFDNIDLVFEDDALATDFHILSGSDVNDMAFSDYAMLPSQKLNSYQVSQKAKHHPFALMNFFARNRALFDENPQNYFLLSNAFLNNNPGIAAGAFKKFFEKYSLPALEQVDFSGENVLETLSFQKQTPTIGSAKVTVIMAAFNAASTIAYSIRSILGQTYQNIELLICDDNSTDNTVEVAKTFLGDPRVRLFASTANQGTYNIRNHLIHEAQGQYITFQDADDVALAVRLERQLAEILKNRHDAVMARWLRIRPNGEVVYFRDHACLRQCVVSLMAPKELFLRYGPYRSVRFGADTEVMEKMRAELGDNAILKIKAPLILGLWGQGSLTQTGGIEVLETGYRGPARRIYAELSSRQRMFGPEVVDNDAMQATLAQAEVALAPSSIQEVSR